MVVLGIMVSAGVTLKQKYDWAQRQEVTTANMALIKKALADYQSKHARLPCPASLTTGIDTPTFGKEGNCAGALVAGTFQDTGRGGRDIRYGAIPVRTLGIPDLTIVDGWGHRYIYAVTEYYATGTPDPFLDNGAISIVDANDTNVTETAGNIIYTVVSPGADQRGAYTLAGTKVENCAGGDTNCVEAGGDGKLLVSVFRQYNTQSATSNMDFTATMTYAASDESYEWRAPPFPTACTCSNPIQTRTARCYIRGTNQRANGKCPISERPALQRSCADFCWGPVDPFPNCPGGCGQPPSTVTRDPPDCLENNDRDVPDSLCIQGKGPHGYELVKSCPGTGSCSSSSTSGAWGDTNGDGRGDSWMSSDGCNSGGGCSSTPGGGIVSGLDSAMTTANDTGFAHYPQY